MPQKPVNNDAIYGWESDDTKALFQAILKLRTVKECEDFFRDLMTLSELNEMAERFKIARMLDQQLSYGKISKKTGASTTTVSRVAHWLHHGRGGYRTLLDRI